MLYLDKSSLQKDINLVLLFGEVESKKEGCRHTDFPSGPPP